MTIQLPRAAGTAGAAGTALSDHNAELLVLRHELAVPRRQVAPTPDGLGRPRGASSWTVDRVPERPGTVSKVAARP